MLRLSRWLLVGGFILTVFCPLTQALAQVGPCVTGGCNANGMNGQAPLSGGPANQPCASCMGDCGAGSCGTCGTCGGGGGGGKAICGNGGMGTDGFTGGGCCSGSHWCHLGLEPPPYVMFYGPIPYWFPPYFGPHYTSYQLVHYCTSPAEAARIAREHINAAMMIYAPMGGTPVVSGPLVGPGALPPSKPATETLPAPKPDDKPETKPETKLDTKPDAKPDVLPTLPR
jgi:hypothetical protein